MRINMGKSLTHLVPHYKNLPAFFGVYTEKQNQVATICMQMQAMLNRYA